MDQPALLPAVRWINAAAPIDRIPLFVRAGSIVPMGAPVQNTSQRQPLERNPGLSRARARRFTLYDDDGVTNAYTKGGGRSAVLHWDDAAGRLSATGTLPTGQQVQPLVKVVR